MCLVCAEHEVSGFSDYLNTRNTFMSGQSEKNFNFNFNFKNMKGTLSNKYCEQT